MSDPSDFQAPLRRCILEPIPAIAVAADALAKALDAHQQGHDADARDLMRAADDPEILAWVRPFLGPASQNPHRFVQAVDHKHPWVPKDQRHGARMPNRKMKAAVVARDRFNCVFCEMPVVRSEVRDVLRRTFPEVARWGARVEDCHAALLAMWLQYDHVLPHSRGGETTLENVVVTCSACNYGRMDNTLEELGLDDPRKQVVRELVWTGLEAFLPEPARW